MATREKQTLASNRYLLVQTKKKNHHKTRLGVSSERSHLQSYVSFLSRRSYQSVHIESKPEERGSERGGGGEGGELAPH